MREVIVQRRTVRIGECDGNVLVEFLEAHPDPGDRPAGSGGAGKPVDPPFELFPQFLRRGLDMRLAVGGIVELAGPDRPVDFLSHPARDMLEMVAIGIFGGRHGDQFRAQCADGLHLFLRLVVGHHDDRAIAKRIRDQRNADPGVAGRALDHRASCLELAPRFGITNDVERGAVLYRGTGIGEFTLAIDVAAGFRAGPLEANQRRIADEVERMLAYGN